MDVLKIFVCDPGKGLDSLLLQSLRDVETTTRGGPSERPYGSPVDLDKLLRDLDPSWAGNAMDAGEPEQIDWSKTDVNVRIRPLQQ